MLNRVLVFSSIILCLIGLLHVLISTQINKRTTRYMVISFTGLFFYSVSVYAGLLMNGLEGEYHRIALSVCYFLEFFFAIIISYSLALYLFFVVDPHKKFKKLLFLNRTVVIVFVVLLVISQFTGWWYSIDHSNHYQRGPGYLVSCGLWLTIILTDVYVMIKHRKKLRGKEKFAFWVYEISPVAAVILQYVFRDIQFISLSITISAIVTFVFITSAQTELYYQNQREIDKLKTDIMLSQIQPHFLYNSLTAIKHLCRVNPPYAEKAITEFASYLRGNMDSLSDDAAIPFTQELNHTKAYLYLEKLRFGDDLNMIFDVQTEAFEMPPLTLQPIVENAVRHGVRETEDGVGTVTVASREYPDRYEVIVTDTGRGFDPDEVMKDEKSHIGIRNVRERLKRVCNGELTIDSVIGQGTKAVITIPVPDN